MVGGDLEALQEATYAEAAGVVIDGAEAAAVAAGAATMADAAGAVGDDPAVAAPVIAGDATAMTETDVRPVGCVLSETGAALNAIGAGVAVADSADGASFVLQRSGCQMRADSCVRLPGFGKLPWAAQLLGASPGRAAKGPRMGLTRAAMIY